jgi:hypothetical protein
MNIKNRLLIKTTFLLITLKFQFKNDSGIKIKKKMLTFLSLVTSIKDYVEVLHKLVETNSTNGITSYYDLGATITFSTLLLKDSLLNFLSFKWVQDLWSIPVLIPDIASSMLSEISIFNGIGQDSFSLLEKPLSYGNQNLLIYCLEKFIIGILNSLFLCFATSTSSVITLRRFIMQGLDAGYIAGLGSIFGNIFWIGSIIFGLRFIVIPWLSLDILRYTLGFILLVKYMWDSYSERRSTLTDLSKTKIFALNFLLAFTEQTNIFPFLNNLSIGSDATILESFTTLNSNYLEFLLIHSCYLLGLLLGSLSLLQFTCWFWENPAYNLYMWTISSFKVTTSFYYKLLNFIFLYLTMICTINSIGYFGLDYMVTNPLGFVHEDRLIEQKALLETSFLNSKASDRNTRRNRGRHGRRERWKRRVRSYRTFDASLYDQGVYDLFTIEDLNYGFDRFWLRRKIRNHRVRFRFFPGPWMRSLKKQFARPRLESFMGPRVEFFRILFEQAYHPEFHEFKEKQLTNSKSFSKFSLEPNLSIYGLSQNRTSYNKKKYYSNIGTTSVLRKFLRKTDNRLKLNKILNVEPTNFLPSNSKNKLYSLSAKTNALGSSESRTPLWWRENKLRNLSSEQNLLEKFYTNLFKTNFLSTSTQKKFTPKSQFMTEYKSFLKANTQNSTSTPLTLLHPLKFYIQKDQALRKKYKFYGVKQYRAFGVENNAPYFRVMMKRFFYYYKPTLRWERTMRVATMRKARRKGSRVPRKWNVNSEISTLANLDKLNSQPENSYISTKTTVEDLNKSNIQKPTHFYSLVSKKASRYRYQIYKDVLQHWYYSKMNRLLLKFDVDSFIRRQPKNNFLTKKEETLLHVKRFLLFEYYNSLRWYNYMQHYDAMKTTIGKTKSLANRAYNQQFFGTFKKIRHLFAITPSFNQTVLKFDQPLYNEYSNTSTKSMVSDSVIHEELKTEDKNEFSNFNQTKELISSAKVLIQNSVEEKSISRQQTIKKFLLEKNYTDLTKFLFNENKLNPHPFLEDSSLKFNSSDLEFQSSENLWFALLKKCQNKLYDQKALKNFVLSKVEKAERQTQKKEKTLKIRLHKVKAWYSDVNVGNRAREKENLKITNSLTNSDFPSTIEKAMKEALNNNFKNKKRLIKKKLTNKNFTNFNNLLFNTKENLKRKFISSKQTYGIQTLKFTNKKLTKILNFLQSLRKDSFGAGAKASRGGKKEDVKKKNLDNWRQAEKVFSKRKKIRKTFKRLKNMENFSFSNSSTFSNKLNSNTSELDSYNRKKLDTLNSSNFSDSLKNKNKKNWQLYDKQEKSLAIAWKKRRSRVRRYRFFKGRGPIKKRTLGEKLKSRFRFLKKYGLINEENKINDFSSSDKNLMQTYDAIFQTLKKEPSTLSSGTKEKNSFDGFSIRTLKQSRTLIKKHRYWKKHKKPTFAQNKRKLRKRRRYLKAKIRVLSKKLKAIEFQSFIKKWWWQSFLPKFQTMTPNNLSNKNFVLTSNYFNSSKSVSFPAISTNNTSIVETSITEPSLGEFQNSESSTSQNNVVNQVMQNIFSSNQQTKNISFNSLNNTPFYAGWDENSRKFVVTNRLLSRKNAGYFYSDQIKKTKEFNHGFLNSMNAATTLYWQIPFTTYDPDQFFALGMDGFSPIGWKNFTFKFSQKTTKPILVKKLAAFPVFNKSTKNLSKNLDIKILKNEFSATANRFNKESQNNKSVKRLNQINQYRRIQKRYKRVKKHPRPPVWFPSGPLSSQILPVHYIYVFYKRYRLPRDRYVRRRLRGNKSQSFARVNNYLQAYNYTLRKRVKPKRKYHRKNFKFLRKNENLVNTILRRPFRAYFNEKIHFRPSSSLIFKEEDIKEKIKPRKKVENKGKLSNKSSRDNLRLRQLRRRVQRQVFRPVWRYKPQAGGFIWPGDYLRLDSIKASKLGAIEKSSNKTVSSRKTRKKKRRMIPEWQIQPKKYLLQKHNIKVLKKRLEKSHNKVY